MTRRPPARNWCGGSALRSRSQCSRCYPTGATSHSWPPPRTARKTGAADITVRVIEYRLEDQQGEVTETFALTTTLVDPVAAPARELAELYRTRWEIETALGAMKTQMKGSGIALRSKTADGVLHEVWALLCAYHAVRELVAAATLSAQDPLQICFVNALDVVRGPVGDPGSSPPRRTDRLRRAALHLIGAVTNRVRGGRSHPRQAKRSTRYPARPADPAQRTKPRTTPLSLIMLPMSTPRTTLRVRADR